MGSALEDVSVSFRVQFRVGSQFRTVIGLDRVTQLVHERGVETSLHLTQQDYGVLGALSRRADMVNMETLQWDEEVLETLEEMADKILDLKDNSDSYRHKRGPWAPYSEGQMEERRSHELPGSHLLEQFSLDEIERIEEFKLRFKPRTVSTPLQVRPVRVRLNKSATLAVERDSGTWNNS